MHCFIPDLPLDFTTFSSMLWSLSFDSTSENFEFRWSITGLILKAFSLLLSFLLSAKYRFSRILQKQFQISVQFKGARGWLQWYFFLELTQHHFIANNQWIFKSEKGLQPFLILDFAENYSFIVQDCVQSYYWNNAQATIHPFVLYYLNPETKEISSAMFSCISDHMTRSTKTVYVFLKTLINHYIKTRYHFLKTTNYFSGGLKTIRTLQIC